MIDPRHQGAKQKSRRNAEMDDQHDDERAREPSAEVGEPGDRRGEEELVGLELIVAEHRGADQAGQDDLSDRHEDQHGLADDPGRVPLHGADAATHLDGVRSHEEESQGQEDRKIEPGYRPAQVIADLEGEDGSEHVRRPRLLRPGRVDGNRRLRGRARAP